MSTSSVAEEASTLQDECGSVFRRSVSSTPPPSPDEESNSVCGAHGSLRPSSSRLSFSSSSAFEAIDAHLKAPTNIEPRHRKIGATAVNVCLVLLVGFGPLIGTAISSRHVYSNSQPWTCLPGGHVVFPWNTTDLAAEVWSSDQLMSINLGFGVLSFATAKTIDIIWDIVVGRFGQMAIAYYSGPLIGRALIHLMEQRPASFELFAALSFKTFTFETLCRVAREMAHPQSESRRYIGWHSVRLAYIFAASSYVLAFPSLLSTMTGYESVTAPFAPMADENNHNLVNITGIDTVALFVRNGSRIGLSNDYPVGSHDQDKYNVFLQYSNLYVANFDLFNHSSFIRLWNGETYSLLSPTLDLEFRGVDPDLPTRNLYTAGNVTFNSSWLQEHSTCQPSGHYRWGFSFLLLFMFCIWTALFTVIISAIWLDVYWHSRYDRTSSGWNLYSAVVQLTHAMTDNIGNGLEPEQLKQEVQKSEACMNTPVDQLPMSRREESRAIRDVSIDPSLLPGTRGFVGFILTTYDVDRVKAVFADWCI